MIFVTQSSLPRSGSELLQVLLSQHPEIYASTTSPLAEYWFGAYKNFSLPEAKSQNQIIMERALKGFLKEGAIGYYSQITNKRVVVDKSRAWAAYAELLWEIFPGSKMLCVVRPLSEILASFETIYRKNTMHPECTILPPNLENRIHYWLKEKPLGLALNILTDRLEKRDHKNMVLLKYSDLCNDTINVMNQVFRIIGVDPFTINPDKIIKRVEENDSHFGIFGNHKVLSQIRPVQLKAPDLFGPELTKIIDDSAPQWMKEFLNT